MSEVDTDLEVTLDETSAEEELGQQATEVDPDLEVQDTELEAHKNPAWLDKRLAKMTWEKSEAIREAQQAREESKALREYYESGQVGHKPDGDIESLIEQRATQKLAEKSFNDQCNSTYELGNKEFPDFQKAIGNLSNIELGKDFLELVTSTDKGARLLHYLGNNLDDADRIASLPVHKMAWELAKLESNLGKAPKKNISNAPAPIKQISSNVSAGKSPDKMSDEEYLKWRKNR